MMTIAWYRSLALCLMGWLICALPGVASEGNEPDAAPLSNQVMLNDGASTYALGRHLAILEDPGKKLSLEDVRASATAGRFLPSTKDVPAYGFSKSAWWVRVKLDQQSRQENSWILELSYPPMQNIELYVVVDGVLRSQQVGGNARPYHERPYVFRTHVFPLFIKSGERAEIYMKFSGENSFSFPLTLWSATRFAQEKSLDLYIFGAYMGIVLGLVLYNAFIFVTLREKSYGYYIAALLSYGLFNLSYNGVTQQILQIESPYLSVRLVPLSMNLMALFSLLFLRNFAGDKVLSRVEGTLVTWLISGFLVTSLVSLWGHYRLATTSSAVLGSIGAMIVLGISINQIRKGNQLITYFLIAWLTLLIGIVLTAGRAFGVIPPMLITSNGVLVGSAAEAIILSIALAARMRILKEEKDKAQADTLSAQRLAIENHESALKSQALAYENQQKALESERISVENLQRMDRLKDEFLANTSHELRTPLNGIIGLAEASLHRPGGELDADLRANLQMIVTSGRRLGSLVNDILDFSKLRHEDIVLSCKATDVRALVDVVLTLSRPLLQQRPLTLVNGIPADLPAVWADENRLQQILHNLVGNALKFTREGSVSVTANVREGRLDIGVTDTGIGIARDRLESIFESFNQGDGSIQREFGGTGLGLSITRKLVELHGGRIHVDSTPGQGSTFRFDLPIATIEQSRELRTGVPLTRPEPVPDSAIPRETETTVPDTVQTSTPPRQPLTGARILVVDDEPVNRQVLRAQLGSAGFAVTEAADGEEALGIVVATDAPFDLVLLDVMMPRLSGYETCTRLRQDHPALILPVIFLTAKSQTEDVLAGFAAGGSDYLLKPFSRDELLARIRIHLELVTTHRIIRDYSKGLEEKVVARTRELVDTQQQLVIKQKKAALGVLTAGVAHEINNPNNFVQVALQNAMAWRESFNQFVNGLLEEDADPEIARAFAGELRKLDDQLTLIETGSRRIDAIVKGLHTITRLDQAEQQTVDVIEGLEQTLRLLKPSLRENLRIETDFQARPRLLCWPAELNQVFMNVLINAVHAIDDQQAGSGGHLQVTSREDGTHLEISISDDGIGMSADVLERACDPFFTTREVGSGSGLGLSISRDIITGHGGMLTLASEPGQGTQVRIILPLRTTP